MRAAFAIRDKQHRTTAISNAVATIKAALSDEDKADENLGAAIKKLEASVLRGDIINGAPRIDGRDTKTIRPIVCETGILPRTHGSALFTRGETQGLLVTTLGTGEDEQFVDALTGTSKMNFLLHYNFPPYSVGEVGRFGPPGRREIGHGKLAWRALQAVLPAATDFPYTIRVVSEITESNGSSSMATVCGGSPVDDGCGRAAESAGCRCGDGSDPGRRRQVCHPVRYSGRRRPPRRHGFQGCGHRSRNHHPCRWTSRLRASRPDIMEKALAQAKDGRLHILGEMAKALTSAQAFSEYAPKIETHDHPDRQDP